MARDGNPDERRQATDPAIAQACEAEGERLYRARRVAEAEARFAQAIALGADPGRTIELRWMCAMLQGEFERAWRISDGVLRREGATDDGRLPLHLRRVWNGQSLCGRRVLIRCYHGLGDTFQFARFFPIVAGMARSLAVEAPPELIPVLRSLPDAPMLLALGDAAPDYDVDIEAMEIAHALRVTLSALPNAVPYLSVPAAARERALGALAPASARFRVGIVWEAGRWRRERSVPFGLISRLAEVPGVALVNLQHGPGRADAAGFPGIFQPQGTDDSVIATAALLQQLDLVVTVDTMVAHLAGALARPIWTLLHHTADWRWMLDRADSPWYPTMRLYRQAGPGDWETVVDHVYAALRALSR